MSLSRLHPVVTDGAADRAADPVLGDQVAQCLADLRALLEDARPVPMSSSVRIHGSDLEGLLRDLERAVRERVAAAYDVEQRRATVLSEAVRQAEEAVHAAEIQRDGLVSDSEVYRVARREADQLLVAAEAEAEGLLRETDAYVAGRLASLESGLRETLEAVGRGRERLAQTPDAPRLQRVHPGPPPSAYAVPPPLAEVAEVAEVAEDDEDPESVSDGSGAHAARPPAPPTGTEPVR